MNIQSDLPIIIQGGMGAAVSSWKLARAVSKLGQLGVVSGTGINTIFIRRLQDGDNGGDIRRALKHFPDQAYISKMLETYFIDGGRKKETPYKLGALPSANASLNFLRISVVASFVEVYLAKENHEGLVGINFLEKLQTSNLPGIYGAMLAGVDYLLMGAGIPREIPSVIDHFSRNESASIKANITGATSSTPEHRIHFSPKVVFPEILLFEIKLPKFLAIISSSTLATHLAKKSNGIIDGFIVETSTAGGHNAPPRGITQFNNKGEPIYGLKDNADVNSIKSLGLPYWLAGSFGSSEKLLEAQALGAVGIQVGTAFAFCQESGISEELKNSVIEKWAFSDHTNLDSVFTDPAASPTDFPFKVVPLEGTLSDKKIYLERPRICDLGYLRQIAVNKSGDLIYRCASEPIEDYLKKGGKIEDTKNRKCLCNGLMSNVGLGQTQNDHYQEPPLITAGDDLINLKQFFKNNEHHYTAKDVIEHILNNKKFKNQKFEVV